MSRGLTQARRVFGVAILGGMIRAIDDRSVDQITSGQVVTSLASALKELVENALDSGATVVEVNIQNHGRDGFSVQDNGSGIAPEDFPNLAKRHATSKLSSFSDLAAVRTLGFRGEALASLCALADVRITTQAGSGAGYELVFDAQGNVISQTKVVRPKGTAVYVTELFRTVPVRRRDFERNYQRELTKAVALLQEYALLSPVRLTVEHNVKNRRSTTLRSQGTKLLQRIACVYGALRTTKLQEVNLTPDDLGVDCSVTGYISKPVFGMGLATSDRQLLAVNGRPSKQPKLARTVVDVYKQFNLTEAPFFVLDFQMDPARYDVNVSPDKRALLLHREAELVDGLRNALAVALSSAGHSVPRSTNEVPSPKRQKQSSLSFAAFAGSGAVIMQSHAAKNAPEVEEGDAEESASASEADEDVASVPGVQDGPRTEEDNRMYPAGEHRSSDIDPPVAADAENAFSSSHMAGQGELSPQALLHTLPPRSASASESDSEPEIAPESAHAVAQQRRPALASETAPCESDLEDEREGEHDDDDDDVEHDHDDHEQGSEHECGCVSSLERDSDDDAITSELSTNVDAEPAPELERSEMRSSLVSGSGPRSRALSASSPLLSSASPAVRVKSELDELPTSPNRSRCHRKPGEGAPREINESQRTDEHFTLLADRMRSPIQARSLNHHIHLPVSLADIAAAQKEVGRGPQDMKTLRKLAIDEEGAEERLSLSIRKQDFYEMEVVGQFNLGFILVVHRKKNHDELFVIDQHASDEIYNFERLQRSTVLSRQPLVAPHPLELSAVDELTIAENLGVFENNGFSIQVSPGNAPGQQCSLLSVPFSKNTVFDEKDVHDLLSKIEEDPGNKHVRCSKLRAMLAMRACRSSIMIGKPLSLSTMRQVVQNLGTLDKPWNCPHGRPTLRHITTLS